MIRHYRSPRLDTRGCCTLPETRECRVERRDPFGKTIFRATVPEILDWPQNIRPENPSQIFGGVSGPGILDRRIRAKARRKFEHHFRILKLSKRVEVGSRLGTLSFGVFSLLRAHCIFLQDSHIYPMMRIDVMYSPDEPSPLSSTIYTQAINAASE
jgi:hypothetical protein